MRPSRIENLGGNVDKNRLHTSMFLAIDFLVPGAGCGVYSGRRLIALFSGNELGPFAGHVLSNMVNRSDDGSVTESDGGQWTHPGRDEEGQNENACPGIFR